MKEISILQVLMYIFLNHMRENGDIKAREDDIHASLEAAGFSTNSIFSATRWLSQLASHQLETLTSPKTTSFRVFSTQEQQHIDAEAQSLILSLEQQGILTPYTREIVINQILELTRDEVDNDLIKWVTLMVLFHQPSEKAALAGMECLVLNDTAEGTH